MSNIEPKCSYPECGPTCRKNCPPLPTKPEPIEPTEEQKQAARDFCRKHDVKCNIVLARLLAEREAKLSKEHQDFFFKNQNDWTDMLESSERREAQHLANVKAWMDALFAPNGSGIVHTEGGEG